MDLYAILDVALYGLMVLDFIIKYFKVRSNIKNLGETKRYHKPYSQTRKMISIVFLVVNLIYVAYRVMQIMNGHFQFILPALVLPVVCYYIISDYLFGGIYYSKKGIYVKSTLIRFMEFEKCYRHYNEQAKGYGYTVYYMPNMQGEAELEFFIENVPEAFELMTRIPFNNEE